RGPNAPLRYNPGPHALAWRLIHAVRRGIRDGATGVSGGCHGLQGRRRDAPDCRLDLVCHCPDGCGVHPDRECGRGRGLRDGLGVQFDQHESRHHAVGGGGQVRTGDCGVAVRGRSGDGGVAEGGMRRALVLLAALAALAMPGLGQRVVPATAWTCSAGLGDGLNAIASGTYLQTTCYNGTGHTVTITGIKCYSDNSGSSTMNVTNGAGTGLLTGAVTCSPSFASGTQSGTTTIASGDYFKFTFVADGTSKQTSWVIVGTY